MQRLDTNYIYKTNTSFFFKHIPCCPGYPVSDNEVLAGFFLLSFPVSCPLAFVVANIKTIVDILTRHPLLEMDVDNLINTIPTLTDKQFNALVANLHKYQAKSRASQDLLRQLKEIDHRTFFEYCERANKCRDKIKQDKVDHFIHDTLILSPKEIETFDVRLKSGYQFSETESEEYKKQEDLLKIERDKKCFALQRDAIMRYLTDGKNAGKKLEWVIKDEVERQAPKNGL